MASPQSIVKTNRRCERSRADCGEDAPPPVDDKYVCRPPAFHVCHNAPCLKCATGKLWSGNPYSNRNGRIGPTFGSKWKGSGGRLFAIVLFYSLFVWLSLLFSLRDRAQQVGLHTSLMSPPLFMWVELVTNSHSNGLSARICVLCEI